MMRLRCFLYLLGFVCIAGCSTAGPEIFKKKSLHDQYAKRIKEAGLDKTAMGAQWLSEAEKALQNPQSVVLPYKEMGYFSSDHPRAVGLNFNAKRGEKLLFEIERNPIRNFALFTELWKVEDDGERSMLLSFDTAQTKHQYEVDETGTYLIRLQPELLRSGDYILSISVGPTLLFPVAGKSGRVGSIWGDERDAGARSHEGIDLFAPKRTPVIAAADGIVTRVNENRLGGKVVWQRPKGKNLSLYYAHLDEQLVHDGQEVKAGDTIGLIGNTGNARTTPPHLHFGIYTFGGAIDPLPFVDPVVKKPLPVPESISNYKKEQRITSVIHISEGGQGCRLKDNTLAEAIAINSNSLRAILPDSSIISIPISKVEELSTLKSQKIKAEGFVFDSPKPDAARKMKIQAGNMISILGYFGDYIYIKTKAGINGWIPASLL
jgi:murein DD-endopeptidase MepM/ murein hydrolase activator NlpD